MQIHLNGDVTPLDQGCRLSELVERLDINLKQVAIEHNREIISRSQLSDIVLQPGDAVEVVAFIGGG